MISMLQAPHKVTSRAREASASPSVSLERGKYRMRAPATPALKLVLPGKQPSPRQKSVSSTRNNAYLTFLLLILASGCLASFGIAYYLFTTRWANHDRHSKPNVSDYVQHQAIALVEAPHTACPPITSGQKFLAYHSHSGFHNQRIALENALTLSHLLNRTLIIPPIRLGKPLRYGGFDNLHTNLALSEKVGSQHCARLSPGSWLPPECFDYSDYTHIPWDWLVDFEDIAAHHRYIVRGNHADQWLHECLGIKELDILTLKESSRYQYRFLDRPGRATSPSDKFDEIVSIPKLKASSAPLLQIGTLFSTNRLLLTDKKNNHIRRRVKANMARLNPILVEVANSIADKLGGSFLGAHVRVGDGDFVKSGRENARSVWWTLVHQTLNLTLDETLALETSASSDTRPIHESPTFALHAASLPAADIPSQNDSHHFPCRGPPSLIQSLNTPLYLATDARRPREDPSLSLFFSTFPCIFTLADMQDNLEPLTHILNGADGLGLKEFLVPFVDAMVLGKSWGIVGTTSSTFSAFAVDVLWPTYHGYGIKERG